MTITAFERKPDDITGQIRDLLDGPCFTLKGAASAIKAIADAIGEAPLDGPGVPAARGLEFLSNTLMDQLDELKMNLKELQNGLIESLKARLEAPLARWQKPRREPGAFHLAEPQPWLCAVISDHAGYIRPS